MTKILEIKRVEIEQIKIMEIEKNIYEQKGLKIDHDRVLTYSQLSCPLECSYCFVEDLNFNQKKRCSLFNSRTICSIKKFAKGDEPDYAWL